MDRIDSITQDIHLAFANVVRCDGLTIHEARLLDDEYCPTAAQLAAARAQSTDVCWKDVSAKTIYELYDTLPFLDAQGRLYYLPAFMVFALNPPAGYKDSGAEDSVVLTLIDVDHYRGEFDSYTTTQRAAIARFLRYMLEEEDAFFDAREGMRRRAEDDKEDQPINAVREALVNYWSIENRR